MIKLEHVVLASPEQMNFIIEGMRNPMNSWDKSDSVIVESIFAEEYNRFISKPEYNLGSADLDLMTRLSNAGTDHRKFMRMMPVYIRITAPLYWWKEFDTYKVGTVRNSCSTMHKIHSKEFDISDFSVDHMLEESVILLEDVINELNKQRAYYLEFEKRNDFHGINPLTPKDIWWQMIQLLPSSYNQTANVMLNYEVLSNMYKSRKNHKLDEWVEFCKWIETLPYSELIIGGK